VPTRGPYDQSAAIKETQNEHITLIGGNDATSSSPDAARATKQLLAVQDAETRAARAVAAACHNWDDDNKITARDAIRPLTKLLWGSDCEAEAAAALALWKLARNSENKVLIAKAGAIPLLVALLQTGTDSSKENAAVALRNLSANEMSRS